MTSDTRSDPRLTPLSAALPASVPFVSPEEMERRQEYAFTARLGANENGFGPSEKTRAAIASAISEVWKYGDSANHDLKAAIAKAHDTSVENITVGEGVDALLGNLVRLTVASGTRVVTSAGAYPTFAYHVVGFGGSLHTVPYRHDHEDLEALLDKAEQVNARLIYLANPDNPMGTMLPREHIEKALCRLSPDTLLVLDEAYAELAPDQSLPRICPDDSRVIRLRSFSKAYGLAGLRVGYALGAPELVAAFDRVRNHFGVNRIAQAAALAAISDTDGLARIRAQIARARDSLVRIAGDNGLTPISSSTNFVAMDCGSDGAFAARVVSALGAEGIFVRMPGVEPLNRCIRVSCGPEAEITRFAEALPKALEQARA